MMHIRSVFRYNKWVSERNREGVMEGKVSGPDGFFTYLVNATDPETGRGWTAEEIWAESSVLVVAGKLQRKNDGQPPLTVDQIGADTIVTGISGTLFYLLQNPEEMDRVTREVRSVFSDVEDIKSSVSLSSCRYLMACVEETLRMTPPAPLLPPRRVLHGGLKIDGHYLPPGTIVGTPIYAIHHNPDYFDDPFAYKPSRWLPEANTEDATRLYKSALCTYSKGPRSCIGRSQAQLQIPLTLARLLFLYDARITPGTHLGEGDPKSKVWGRHRKGEYQTRDWFTAEREGPSVQFRLAKYLGS
jgi:hypothetical protein